jgi:hypothetical protein
MAKVHLRSYQGQPIVDLPPVCMVCGAPATVRKIKQFSWQPQWVILILLLAGPLPYVIVALIMTKRQKVDTPLCDRHSTYWWLFPTLLVLTLVAILGSGVVGLIAVDIITNASRPGIGDYSGLVCLVTGGVGIVWLIVAAVLSFRRIRPQEISERHIELVKVSRQFANAIEEQEEQDHRASRNFGREFDDDLRSRRPRPASNDDRYSDER